MEISTIILLVLIALIALQTIYDLVKFTYLFILGKWLVQKSERYERKNTKLPYTFTFFGDSTTVGTGASDPILSVAGRFASEFPYAQILNYGTNGQRIEELDRMLKNMKIPRSDLMIVQIGGNNIVHPGTLDHVRTHLVSILTQLQKKCPRIIVLHCGNAGSVPFWPWYVRPVMSYRTLLVRYIYQTTIAQFSGVTYLDLFTEVRDDPFLPNIKKFYAPDLFHPSGDGYAIWYIQIRELMDRIKWRYPFGRGAKIRSTLIKTKDRIVKEVQADIKKTKKALASVRHNTQRKNKRGTR